MMKKKIGDLVRLGRNDSKRGDHEEAAAILDGMPSFWRSKFEALAIAKGTNRHARRATAALLRRYASWVRRTELLRARQERAKAIRAHVHAIRDANRAERGKQPLK